MLKYNKSLEVGDFIDEINRASEKADTIFTQLGLDRSRQWFRDDNGSYNTIETLVQRCLDTLHQKNKKPVSNFSGGFTVEMFVDDYGVVNLDIYFKLN